MTLSYCWAHKHHTVLEYHYLSEVFNQLLKLTQWWNCARMWNTPGYTLFSHSESMRVSVHAYVCVCVRACESMCEYVLSTSIRHFPASTIALPVAITTRLDMTTTLCFGFCSDPAPTVCWFICVYFSRVGIWVHVCDMFSCGCVHPLQRILRFLHEHHGSLPKTI